MKRKTILLAAAGKQDPLNNSGADGPVLSLLSERRFAKAYLFATTGESGTVENARETLKIINERYPSMQTEIVELNIPDPYAYSNIMKELRNAKDIYMDNIDAQLFILIGPGLPQMQTCWFLLASSGEIPANLLYVREPRFVKKGQASTGEIDPRSRELPHIEPKIILKEIKAISREEIDEAIKKVGIITNNEQMRAILIDCAKYAQSDDPVLITGESGTGKELIARFIQLLSRRKNGTFISFNCANLPEGILNDELFGHVPGAFTGAEEEKQGIIEAAHKGTLFLDEIGDLPMNAQSALLRAIQEKKITRLGRQVKEIDVDIRIISATNKDISKPKEGSLRRDFYHRINTFEIKLPPLRERKCDIPILAMHFLKQHNKNEKTNKEFDQKLLAYIQNLEWEGNIRELRSIVTRVATRSESDIIGIDDFEKSYKSKSTQSSSWFPEFHEGFSLDKYINEMRDMLFTKALEEAKENQSEAARKLGVTSQAVHNYLKKIKPGFKRI